MRALDRESLWIEEGIGPGERRKAAGGGKGEKGSERQTDRELSGRIEDSGLSQSTRTQEDIFPVSTGSSNGIKMRARESPVQVRVPGLAIMCG